MQLPRVVIAAVFFAIGALIAIPAIWNTATADGTPAGSTTSPTASPTSGTPAPTATGTSASPSGTASASPTGTRSSAPPAPARPLQVTIGQVRCPGRTVQVTVRNTGPRAEDFAIERNDGTAAVPGRIAAGQSRTIPVTLREDRRTTLQITLRNEQVRSRSVTANCRTATPTPDDSDSGEPTPSESESPDVLPSTGPDDAMLWARLATGAAAMVTGVIIFWYGGVWPRRREHIFGGKADD